VPTPPAPGAPTAYDLVPYPASTHPQTHPESLAVVGTLFGLRPAPATRCRVLELGASNGSNLIPMAATLPESEFVGIDLAKHPVEQGQELIRELGLKNIRLCQGDLAEVDAAWGEFDYILAHGIYSWVPAPVREKILALCRDRMTRRGMAFISYNAYPGGHARNMVREMMRFHVRGTLDPEERMNQAVALTRFLAQSVSRQDPYRVFLGGELDTILKHDRNHLYHDELAEVNDSFYFAQFIEHAAAFNLQYVGEADFFEMFDHGYTAEAKEALSQLASNRLLREQYLDFLKCRRFRQTLLCHAGQALRAEPDVEVVSGFLARTRLEAVDQADLRPGVTLQSRTSRGARVETDYSLGKAALSLLSARWPAGVEVRQLHRESLELLRQKDLATSPQEEPLSKLSHFLLQLFSAGVLELHTFLPNVPLVAGEKPTVYPVARRQARTGAVVTTLYHQPARLEDEVALFLIRSLDGTLDRAMILDKLWELLASKGALEYAPGEEEKARQGLAAKLEENLATLAKLGLLVG